MLDELPVPAWPEKSTCAHPCRLPPSPIAPAGSGVKSLDPMEAKAEEGSSLDAGSKGVGTCSQGEEMAGGGN